MLAWSIWNSRNKLIFQNVTTTANHCYYQDVTFATNYSSVTSVHVISRTSAHSYLPFITWHPEDMDIINLNFVHLYWFCAWRP